jgi:hypothetical protein
MFSFIKTLQSLISNLKKKKGLWFTLLTLVAVLGISSSMYLLTTMTKGVAKEVYLNMSNTYKTTLDNKLDVVENDFRKIFVGLNANQNLQDNLNDPTVINQIITAYQQNYNQAGFTNVSFDFYTTVNQINNYRTSVNSVITRRSSSFGVEILPNGPYLVSLNPIIDGENILGVVEIKQPLITLKADFETSNGIFVFLMEQKMLSNLSTEAKNGKYRDIFDELVVEEEAYDGQFFGNIIESGKEDFKQFKDEGYMVNDDYFKTYKKLSDINGTEIGYFVVGERVEGSGAFVNIVDNLTKTVTTVALGLVISILLFMF